MAVLSHPLPWAPRVLSQGHCPLVAVGMGPGPNFCYPAHRGLWYPRFPSNSNHSLDTVWGSGQGTPQPQAWPGRAAQGHSPGGGRARPWAMATGCVCAGSAGGGRWAWRAVSQQHMSAPKGPHSEEAKHDGSGCWGIPTPPKRRPSQGTGRRPWEGVTGVAWAVAPSSVPHILSTAAGP